MSGLKKVKILSYGINQIGDKDGLQPGIHAEIDGLTKLTPLNTNRKRLIHINLIVVRISKKNKLQSSKPCIKCINALIYNSKKKGYHIKHIYYSDHNNNIIKSNLNTLLKEDLHLSSFYRNLR